MGSSKHVVSYNVRDGRARCLCGVVFWHDHNSRGPRRENAPGGLETNHNKKKGPPIKSMKKILKLSNSVTQKNNLVCTRVDKLRSMAESNRRCRKHLILMCQNPE